MKNEQIAKLFAYQSTAAQMPVGMPAAVIMGDYNALATEVRELVNALREIHMEGKIGRNEGYECNRSSMLIMTRIAGEAYEGL